VARSVREHRRAHEIYPTRPRESQTPIHDVIELASGPISACDGSPPTCPAMIRIA
jgi:hypothetical protein